MAKPPGVIAPHPTPLPASGASGVREKTAGYPSPRLGGEREWPTLREGEGQKTAGA